jgi:hypothetical protein
MCDAILEQRVVFPDPLGPFTKIILASKIFSSDGDIILFAKQ